MGGTMPAVLNAANEVAVEAFLQEQIAFTDISAIIAQVLETHAVQPLTTIDDALEADRRAREKANSLLTSMRK
jgi:1-deoxy-D-xylulose-5-phosphate reductoisomerase